MSRAAAQLFRPAARDGPAGDGREGGTCYNRPMIRVGELAPDFSAMTSTGSVLRLSERRGRWVVLYFFPKAFTAG